MSFWSCERKVLLFPALGGNVTLNNFVFCGHFFQIKVRKQCLAAGDHHSFLVLIGHKL